jgi:hypothetical protein
VHPGCERHSGPTQRLLQPLAAFPNCSAVVFGSSFTNTDRLDGFKIIHGSGIDRASEHAIAGAGVFVLSSPTISNNLIVGNTLTGNEDYLVGAGVYLNATTNTATPVITLNTIDGNRAVPPSGTTDYYNYGIGGGIYAGRYSHPTISQNRITNNAAGDSAVVRTTGMGAGVAVYSIGSPQTVITRNVISGNVSDNDGAGIYLASYDLLLAHSMTAVTNNQIIGNRSGRRGGGISTFYSIADIVNNTIVSNTAISGGGIYVARGGVSDQVLISNNLITGNNATDTNNGGGGLYVSIDPPLTPLSVRNNDFNGNTPAGKQVAGARIDANTIGVQGNINVNPNYVNAAASNFHLNAGSGVIDKGNSADSANLPIDFDGTNRIQDGDANCFAIVDMGAFEFLQADADGDGSPTAWTSRQLDPLNDQDGDGIRG